MFAGLSVGREGPSIQLGAMAGDGAARTLKRTDDERRELIIAGACAGLAAAFNAPLAGIMFALEELKKSNPYLEQCRIICDSDAHYLEHIHEPEWKMRVREKSAAAVIAYLRGE